MMPRRVVLGVLLLTTVVLVVGPAHAARRAGFENNSGAVAYGLRVEFDKPVTVSEVTGPFTNWTTQNGGKVIVFLDGEAKAWANVYFSWEPEDAKISSHEWLSEVPALDEVSKAEEQVPETSGPTREPLRIYFVSVVDENQDIYYMNLDGSGVTRVTYHPKIDNHVVVSLDGKMLAFASNRSNSNVYVSDSGGKEEVKLTFKGNNWPYTWFFGSQKIAFVTDRDGNLEVYSMNEDGSEQTNLTRHSSKDFCATGASPDGQWIAFASDRPGNDDIYVMNVDGTEQKRLTDHPADDWTPAWSLDGKSIIFSSARDGNFEIYVMNADGSGVKRLTNSPVHDFWPRYQPKPAEEEG